MAEEEIIEVAEIIEDTKAIYKRAQARVAKAGMIEGRVAFEEVTNNVYPLLVSILDKLNEQEAALMEIADGGEYLAPETAGTVLGALQLGDQLCAFIEAIQLTDTEQAQGKKLVAAFRAAAGLARQAVTELVDDAGGEGDEPEDGNQ